MTFSLLSVGFDGVPFIDYLLAIKKCSPLPQMKY